jgi:hypothetical protein
MPDQWKELRMRGGMFRLMKCQAPMLRASSCTQMTRIPSGYTDSVSRISSRRKG